eukprot:scaffold109_cov252-Pinguiococcus_pyrenoidosus.AAC.41
MAMVCPLPIKDQAVQQEQDKDDAAQLRGLPAKFRRSREDQLIAALCATLTSRGSPCSSPRLLRSKRREWEE